MVKRFTVKDRNTIVAGYWPPAKQPTTAWAKPSGYACASRVLNCFDWPIPDRGSWAQQLNVQSVGIDLPCLFGLHVLPAKLSWMDLPPMGSQKATFVGFM